MASRQMSTTCALRASPKRQQNFCNPPTLFSFASNTNRKHPCVISRQNGRPLFFDIYAPEVRHPRTVEKGLWKSSLVLCDCTNARVGRSSAVGTGGIKENVFY